MSTVFTPRAFIDRVVARKLPFPAYSSDDQRLVGDWIVSNLSRVDSPQRLEELLSSSRPTYQSFREFVPNLREGSRLDEHVTLHLYHIYTALTLNEVRHRVKASARMAQH